MTPCLRTLILAVLLAATVSGQVLLTSTTTSARRPGGAVDDFHPADILALEVGLGGPVEHQATVRNFTSLIGDADGNGVYDDEPERIDALCHLGGTVSGDVLGTLVSFDRNTTVLGGSLLDGDVVAFMPSGNVVIVHAEATFAQSTSTTSVDIDAFHQLGDGTLLFSFADDETTTDPTLIAANGGDARIDETTVFELSPGAQTATMRYTRSDVLAFVNNALGSSLSSVVDLVGLTTDPADPTELLFTCGSSNSALEGTVFTTAGGGAVASANGLPLDSTSLGFDEQEVLGSLALLPARPYTLRLIHPDTRPAPAGMIEFPITGATPGGTVGLFMAWTALPAPVSTAAPGLGGSGQVYLDLADPLFQATIAHPGFRQMTDMNGDACFTFMVQGVLPGLSMTFQAFDLTAFVASLPITATS